MPPTTAPVLAPVLALVLEPVVGDTMSVVVSGGPVVEMSVVVPGVKGVIF